VQLYVLSFIDHAHAAAAQLIDYAVVRDGFSDHWERLTLWRDHIMGQVQASQWIDKEGRIGFSWPTEQPDLCT
jgi:hypothetical protein